MVLTSKRYSLTAKFSLLITATVILVLAALGFYFDAFLKQNFLDTTQTRMQHGYVRLANKLHGIESQLQEGTAFVKTDESMIASVDLINNYQDKTHYNASLLDEEKKVIVQALLNRVKLSFNSDIALYDQNEELIAYVTREDSGYLLNFISFAGGERRIYQRYEYERDFRIGPPTPAPNIAITHVSYYELSQLFKNSIVTYLRLNDDVVIKSHQSLFAGNSGRVVAHIELSNILNKAYFEKLSQDLDLDIRGSFDQRLENQATLLGEELKPGTLKIVQSDEDYVSAMKIVGPQGPIYFVARLDKTSLNAALNENRRQLAILLILVAAATLLLMRFIINSSLARPLARLMAQIRKIEQQDYSTTEPLDTGDELEAISSNVNELAVRVKEREASLERSKSEHEFLSNHDALTNLPNRRVFSERLQHALTIARRNRDQVAIFFLDLDQFKLVNDTLGHDVGDDLLQRVSERLQQNIRATDTLARIGGDEFNVLIEGIHDVSELVSIVAKYVALFHAPFRCGANDIRITVSIGAAIYPKDGEDSVTLIKNADLAMYKAKESGRNSYRFFSDDLSARIKERAEMTHALKLAVESENQFELYYQPKVSATTRKVVSIEALVRWHSPDLGTVSPASFIPLAEETGLIRAIGDWVMQQSCHDFVQLLESGAVLEHVSINVSNVQLRDNETMAVLKRAIKSSGIKPTQIELEITESYIATDVAHAIKQLQDFRQMGVTLAIDDFGTGYSSISYLQKLPVTRLKIDKSFVDGVPHDTDSVAITRSIISLAKNLGLAITAEGVEREEQLHFLEKEKCDEIQGYYYAKPMPLQQLMEFCRPTSASIRYLDSAARTGRSDLRG
jgi:diguanylate cyclase (GGDEF)-like protein